MRARRWNGPCARRILNRKFTVIKAGGVERGRVPWQNRPLDFTAYYSSQDAQYLSVISPGPRRFVATISVNRSLIALRILPRIPFVALHPSSMIYRRFIAPLPIQTALLIYEWRDRLSPFRVATLLSLLKIGGNFTFWILEFLFSREI